jgi:DUF1365 family protein
MTPIVPIPVSVDTLRKTLGADATDRAANDSVADAAGQISSATDFSSAIYEGWVRHRRHTPHANHFRYRIYMMYVDLAELDSLFARRWLWSVDRRNVAQFRRSDYFGDPTVPLDQAVRDRVAQETGRRPHGPIRLLAHLRYFGFCFNPVSFYYCFAEDGVTLETIVADITNTPWKERHAYVLTVATAQHYRHAFGWSFDKSFHVSPFLPMQCRYDWRFSVPAQRLHVHMNVHQSATPKRADERDFDATLVLQRQPFTPGNLARVLARYPLMTFRVVAAIHWQALRIWWRGNPVFDHPPPAPVSSITPVPEHNHDA